MVVDFGGKSEGTASLQSGVELNGSSELHQQNRKKNRKNNNTCSVSHIITFESEAESTNKKDEDVAQTQLQRPELPKDMPLVEFMYLVFARMPGESYCR